MGNYYNTKLYYVLYAICKHRRNYKHIIYKNADNRYYLTIIYNNETDMTAGKPDFYVTQWVKETRRN